MNILINLLSAPYLSRWVDRYAAWFLGAGAILYLVGIVWGVWFTPTDFQQGDIFRIIYLHVPAAALSLGLYVTMSVMAFIFLVWQVQVADAGIAAVARIGWLWTAIALITGMLWGRSTWGTAWIWDARLTAELVLLFLYTSIILTRNLIPEAVRAQKFCALVVLLGSVDIPVVHFSVNWWNTLHQGASILHLAKPTIAPSMLHPLLCMFLATTCLSVGWCAYLCQLNLWHIHRRKRWVKKRMQEVSHG